jgi:hypothetical protein
VKAFVAEWQAKGTLIDSYTLPVSHSFECLSLASAAIPSTVLVLTTAGSRSRVDTGWAIELERAEVSEPGMLGCEVMLDQEMNSIRAVEVFEDGAEECGGKLARDMVGTSWDGMVDIVVVRPVMGFLAR